MSVSFLQNLGRRVIRALASLPAIPDKFFFTVRDDAFADQINAHIGQK